MKRVTISKCVVMTNEALLYEERGWNRGDEQKNDN